MVGQPIPPGRQQVSPFQSVGERHQAPLPFPESRDGTRSWPRGLYGLRRSCSSGQEACRGANRAATGEWAARLQGAPPSGRTGNGVTREVVWGPNAVPGGLKGRGSVAPKGSRYVGLI